MAVEAATIIGTAEQGANPEVNPKPRTIRAHHLRLIGWAIGLGEIGELTGTAESAAAAWTEEVCTWLESPYRHLRRYALSTVGRGARKRQQYQDNLAKGFDEFICASESPEDPIYTIIEESPDDLFCGRMVPCAMARHCSEHMAKLNDGTHVELDETQLMDKFLAVLDMFGPEYIPYIIEMSTSSYADAEQKPTRNISLRASEIRRVLMHMPNAGYAHFFKQPEWVDEPSSKEL